MNLPSPAMKAFFFLSLKILVHMLKGSFSRCVIRRSVSVVSLPVCCCFLELPLQKGNGMSLLTFVKLCTTSSIEGRREGKGRTQRAAT